MNAFRLHSIIGLFLFQLSACAFAADMRDRPFDSDWRFFRGDASGAQNPAFDDSQWRKLDLPHDWSIEDLPPRTNAVPALAIVDGEWRFQPGDDADWKASDFNDSNWQRVQLPDNWERHSNHTNENVYGWFRRRIEIPERCRGRDFDLLLGQIDDVDEAFLNGQRIGGTGSFPPNYQTAYSTDRRYRVPAALVRGDGTDVLAVRVFDGQGNGGLVTAGLESVRIGPFDSTESANGHFTGYTEGGIGWYRKHFALDETNRRVAVRFDGVYMNSEVWINGHRLGEHPHGYTAFEFDLTPHLKPAGQTNVLAVRVRNEGRNSRWYSGSGIYRHVWLTVHDPIHVPTWGVFVSTPEVSKQNALVKVSVEVRNTTESIQQPLVRVRIRDARSAQSPDFEVWSSGFSRHQAWSSGFSRHQVWSSGFSRPPSPLPSEESAWSRSRDRERTTLHLAPGETASTNLYIPVRAPKLWSTESPILYVADVEVLSNSRVTDSLSTTFGIRKIEVDAEHGFRLNGQPLKLKGGCLHHDNGPLGAAAIDRAEERRVELIKASGFNAVRSSHNPPSSAFLDACDRLGLLVIDEAFDQWRESKENNQQDYHRFFEQWSEHDIASMVRRDRNHPSVIMWSIGNEIPEQFRAPDTARRLRECVLSHDPTRPVTQGISSDWGRVARNWDTLSDPAFLHLDVAGYNYLPDKYERDHARHPERVILGTESYPKDAFRYWSLVEKHSYVIGDFVWSVVDYLGEAGLAHSLLSNERDSFFMSWPWFNAWCGDLDICGFKKPQSFYRDVLWRRSQIEMFAHAPIPAGLREILSGWAWRNEHQSWNWPGHEGTPIQVSVYSRCDAVRLELNGKVVGEQSAAEARNLTFTFSVPYAPGELRAIGLMKGKVVAQTKLQTTGAPTKLKVTTDRTRIRADRNDLAYVTIEVVDANGARVPNAAVPVRFAVSGVGELAAQGSGTPNQPASFRAPKRTTFEGRCLAILRPTGAAGDITLRVQADGLESAAITLRAR